MPCKVSGFTLNYSGSLQGRGVNTFRWIVDCRTGKSYTDGTETFTGSVEGVGSGTFSWGVQSNGTFDCKKGEVTSVSANENLYCTDALAGLYRDHAQGPGDVYAGGAELVAIRGPEGFRTCKCEKAPPRGGAFRRSA